MATLSIQVSDADVPRITAAFSAVYGIPSTPAAVKNNLVSYIKQTVKSHEGMKAGSTARKTAEEDAENIGVS